MQDFRKQNECNEYMKVAVAALNTEQLFIPHDWLTGSRLVVWKNLLAPTVLKILISVECRTVADVLCNKVQ